METTEEKVGKFVEIISKSIEIIQQKEKWRYFKKWTGPQAPLGQHTGWNLSVLSAPEGEGKGGAEKVVAEGTAETLASR